MRVKCVICDKIESIEDHSVLAKKLRNRPIHTYMCQPCGERIAVNTKKRTDTGNFRFYRSVAEDDEW
ncbi:YlaI family protein [Mesobacillus harenae]|uniref:YlaI family protein n=1 Tax=Mesobacillus harenae TaxID=2213203 RepID=UPI00157FCC47|nr:YlaI family protein [Mesobacillus harenae]